MQALRRIGKVEQTREPFGTGASAGRCISGHCVRELRVLQRELEVAALVAALWHVHVHPAATLLLQPLPDHLGLGGQLGHEHHGRHVAIAFVEAAQQLADDFGGVFFDEVAPSGQQDDGAFDCAGSRDVPAGIAQAGAGGLAVGFMPVWVPREVLHAQGVLPVGLRGAGDDLEIIRGDAYYQSYICHIPRSTIELALNGSLDVLDGMLFPAICDVIRNLSGIWKMKFADKLVRYYDPPQDFTEGRGGQFGAQIAFSPDGQYLFLAVGSSLQVYPIAGAVDIARRAGAKIVIVNAERTPFDEVADAVFNESISAVLLQIISARESGACSLH